MAISKELTQKVRRTDSSEEDEEDVEDMEDAEDKEYIEHKEDEEDEIPVDDKEGDIKTESEIDDFIKLCRQFYDKKQQKKGKKTEIGGTSDEIIPETEKETSCRVTKRSTSQTKDTSGTENKLSDEKNCALKANISKAKSKSRGNKKSDTLQGKGNDTKSKLRNNEKSDTTSRGNTNDTKSESCSNKKNSTSLANTNNVKAGIHKEKQNNKKSISQDTNKVSDCKATKKENSKRKLNPKVQEGKKKKLKANKMERSEEEEKEDEDYSPSLEFEIPKRKPILDSPLEETTSSENVHKDSDLASLKKVANTVAVQKPVGVSHEVEIDPKKYVNVKPKHLKTHLPDIATGGDEDSEQEEETHRIMSEAFADDDVVEEFRKEQEEEVRNKNFKRKLYFSYVPIVVSNL